VKRRHQVNHDLLLIGLPRKRKRLVVWATSVVAAIGLTGALAIPIVAQTADNRQGNMPIAIDANAEQANFSNSVYVSQDAPLNAFGGSGHELAIDGRPLGRVEGAAESSEEAESETETALLAGAVGAIGQLPGGLQLMHPVPTRRISSPYGWRSNPTGAGNQIHIGQDYPISCGSPVYASEAGRVIVSGWHGHSGMRVTIDHGNNVQTGYSHNSKLVAKIGQEVKQGELIALAGTTGNSTGCHVHFEVIVDGRWHDPRNYLPNISGQPNAMIDSTRLTVNSNSAPKGNGSNGPQSQAPNRDQGANPDVVVPENDTPVVPKPKPKPKPSPSDSNSPSPTESKSPSPSDSNTPSPTDTKSPSPTDTKTPSPTDGTKDPSPPEGSESPTDGKDTPSPKPSVPETEAPPTSPKPKPSAPQPEKPESNTPQPPSDSNSGGSQRPVAPKQSGSASNNVQTSESESK
jgi:murein DD-endopeptidase MepM/ murein hydrolase activator NlpD